MKIPHRSNAILISEHAGIKNPLVGKLAGGIIESRRREIDEIKRLIKKFEDKE